jgi:hypothetical protein
MIHPELAELKSWDRTEYVAGYGARLSAIPKAETAHYCWRVDWDVPTWSCWNRLVTIASLLMAEKITIWRRGDCSLTPEEMRG